MGKISLSFQTNQPQKLMTFGARTSAVAIILGLIEKTLQFSEQLLYVWTQITFMFS